MIDVYKLEQFFVLAKMGSFTKASVELNLSQSALTRSVQALEKQLGVRLLERERGKTGVTLTPVGVDLFTRADALLEQLAAMEASVAERPTRATRKLGFGLGPMMANAFLSDLLQRRLHSDPDLAISVYTITSDLMTSLLLDGVIDFYLGLASPRHHSARIRHQFFAPVVSGFYVRPGHPLAGQTDITDEQFLHYPRISGTAWNEKLMSQRQHRDHYLFAATVQVDDYSILTLIAEHSDAILMSSSIGFHEGLVRLPLKTEIAVPETELHIFSLAGVRLSSAAEDVLGDLRAAYEGKLAKTADALDT